MQTEGLSGTKPVAIPIRFSEDMVLIINEMLIFFLDNKLITILLQSLRVFSYTYLKLLIKSDTKGLFINQNNYLLNILRDFISDLVLSLMRVSTQTNANTGVKQGSVLDSLLFHIYSMIYSTIYHLMLNYLLMTHLFFCNPRY